MIKPFSDIDMDEKVLVDGLDMIGVMK